MSRLFAAATDKITVTTYAAINGLTAFTISSWIWQVSEGGNSQGGVIWKNDWFRYMTNFGTMHFTAQRWQTTTGQWTWARTYNRWRNEIVMYDYGSNANDPVVYSNGASIAVTESVAPTGALSNNNLDVVIGNTNGTSSNWAGLIAEVAIWNRILNSDELATVYGRSASLVTSGRVMYFPLLGNASPEPNTDSANSGALTGTDRGIHAPLPELQSIGGVRTIADF